MEWREELGPRRSGGDSCNVVAEVEVEADVGRREGGWSAKRARRSWVGGAWGWAWREGGGGIVKRREEVVGGCESLLVVCSFTV